MSFNENEYSNAVQLLTELRSRLINALIVFMLLFASLMYFANDLYTLLALPLLRFLPQGHLIATQIVSPFFVPFKLAFMAAMFLGVPYFLYQLWAFIAPALYGYERRLVWPFMLASGLLFYAGLAFAYFIIFPMLFHFLAGVAPRGVMLTPDISEYLDFTIKLLLVFGGLFEIPIVMLLLVSAGVVSCERLIAMRSYAIVGAFVVGMLIAPPDVLSQTILAVPIWLLYEAGILLSRFAVKKGYDQNNEE
ncbi:MAG TPA: twin-arginine translocase subunit TatC [Gammaproteobacteria bacterium]|jgi:sec-independent protein translocase protein TatC|nr:twin-arginine translocase subunit TatC [Gammaproteobacteria bacterium]